MLHAVDAGAVHADVPGKQGTQLSLKIVYPVLQALAFVAETVHVAALAGH